MKLLSIGAAALCAVAFWAIAFGAAARPAVSETTILPGYWESENKVSFIGDQDSVSRKCITPDQVESYLIGPSNNHYTCTYDHRAVGGGKVALAGQCVDNGGRKIAVVITGAYAKTRFDLNAQLSGNLYGLQMSGKAETHARRISDVCPVAEKK